MILVLFKHEAFLQQQRKKTKHLYQPYYIITNYVLSLHLPYHLPYHKFYIVFPLMWAVPQISAIFL